MSTLAWSAGLASKVIGVLSPFVFVYPLLMSYVWAAGALVFYFVRERRDVDDRWRDVVVGNAAPVAVVVPCYNEEDNVDEVITHLLGLRYPSVEIIAVNDGSRDATGARLDRLAARHPQVRVIHQAKNQGKAVALITAATLARSEVLVCIDGDALLDADALPWMLRHFAANARVAAVTGNPRIRTRSTILGKLQVGEFSAIIGMIKRAQSVFGRLYSVSGVIVAFRRSALHDVGYWSPDMMCEDIDITWKLQLAGWEVRYEPHALCWILMPETLVGLWRQRVRWAMGGVQVLAKYAPRVFARSGLAMLPVFVEYAVSVAWAYAMAALMLAAIVKCALDVGSGGGLGALRRALAPGWAGLWLGTTCLAQMLLSLSMERRYERGLLAHYAQTIWYPIAFWMLAMLTTVAAVPRVVLRKRGARARWVSPDRGATTPVFNERS